MGITCNALTDWVPGLWEKETWHDLNQLIPPDSGWRLLGANDINDAGQITGVGWFEDAYLHAFLLTPVPEPGTLSLLIAAGLSALAYAWRHRRS